MEDHLAGLYKVLALERSKDCSDSAVIGGLDSYLSLFLKEHKFPPSSKLGAQVRSILKSGYAQLDPAERLQRLNAILDAPRRPAPAARRRSPAREPKPELSPSDPISALAPVTKAAQAKLAKLGLATILDLLFHLPHRYQDFSQVHSISELRPREEQTVLGSVWTIAPKSFGRYRKATEAIVSDGTGTLRVIWWGQRYLANQIKPGMSLALSGKVSVFRGGMVMESPEYEPLDITDPLHTQRLIPVYPSTEGLPQRTMRRAVKQALGACAGRLADPLPEEVRRRQKLLSIGEALTQIHYPDSRDAAAAARRRLAFDELLTIQLAVLGRRKARLAAGPAYPLAMAPAILEGFLQALPFPLTSAQQKAMAEVFSDLSRETAMSRLLQGDVGSGKTVIAIAALIAAAANGFQGAIMAPTEILAEQHFNTIGHLLGGIPELGPLVTVQPPYLDRPLNIGLLTGSLTNRAKSLVQAGAGAGQVDIIAGTHALIQGDVAFTRLGLAIVDEQHRFGVGQRAALRAKSEHQPHLLVMTATPIPRTLALTIYGDLDISVINELPPGRRPVKTTRVFGHEREEAYQFIREQIARGRQAYVICPLVEESESIEARAAVQEYQRLSEHVFPDLRMGLLHGRMSPAEKDRVMRSFRDGALDILVSTAVVEVGVDVPNATVILIEAAERFGLAQLHQFRGRVCRSHHQSFCLLQSESISAEALERLRILEATNDGFALAEEDLRLRGPGEFFGARQSGLPDLHAARLTDVEIIEQARGEAALMLTKDPMLERPEHQLIADKVRPLWAIGPAEAAAGALPL